MQNSWGLASGSESRQVPSPSPLPSPLGRGSHADRLLQHLGVPDSPAAGRTFSLSPRERAGVRGNRPCAMPESWLLQDACNEQLVGRALRARRWASDAPGNPKGIASLSPGLRGTSYPGFAHRKSQQPCKGCITVSAGPAPRPCHPNHTRAQDSRSNPFRVEPSSHRTPRVARASQPWAERYHPFRMMAGETLVCL